jgi:hypothetical protein
MGYKDINVNMGRIRDRDISRIWDAVKELQLRVDKIESKIK